MTLPGGTFFVLEILNRILVNTNYLPAKQQRVLRVIIHQVANL